MTKEEAKNCIKNILSWALNRELQEMRESEGRFALKFYELSQAIETLFPEVSRDFIVHKEDI